MDKQLVLEKIQAIGELAIDCEPFFGETAYAGRLEEMVSIDAELEAFVVEERLSVSPSDGTSDVESSQVIATDFGADSTTTLAESDSFELPVEVQGGEFMSVNGSRGTGRQYPASWPRERIAEWDPENKSGNSGISGMKFRPRNGHKDRGEYARQMHLMSTQGHNPIAVPGGVDALLRQRGIYDKYKNRPLSHEGKILFDKADHFRVHWIRRKDGTRIFVRVV